MGHCLARDCLQQEGPSLLVARLPSNHNQTKCGMSTEPGKRPSFLGTLVDNLKSEYTKSKNMQESLAKFREEAKRLEESEALQNARQKFKNIEKESAKPGALKEQLSGLTDKLKDTVEDLSKHETVRKASEFTGNIGEKTKGATESIGRAAETISQTSAFQSATKTASQLKEELESHSLGGKVYRAPRVLRKRKESIEGAEAKTIEADETSTGVEMHKDSRFSQSWQNFKDSNPVVNKFVDYRVKFEESDSPIARGARMLTDKVQDIFGAVFTRTELSETLTEIVKMDPTFEKEQFLKDCEADIIPNILEAISRGNLEVLEDWCYEAPYNVLAAPIRQAQTMGLVMDSRVLDIDSLDLAMGKMMEQGPVLVITFNSQQLMCVRDRTGKVVEGSEDKVMRVAYVWVLCRDQAEVDPRAAWRLLDLSANSQEQFL